MIAKISGIIIHRGDDSIVVENRSGIGYEVNVPSEYSVKYRLGSDVEIWTYHHVREDQDELFGFERVEELNFFKRLLSVAGIGPRVAINIVASTSVSAIAGAIKVGNLDYLTKLAGIGKKTAEKIVLELRDKLDEYASDVVMTGTDEAEIIEALVVMGYNHSAAREAVKKIDPDEKDLDEKIREALKVVR